MPALYVTTVLVLFASVRLAPTKFNHLSHLCMHFTLLKMFTHFTVYRQLLALVVIEPDRWPALLGQPLGTLHCPGW